MTEEVLTDLDKRGLESSLQSPLFALRRLSGSSQQALRRLSAQESLRKLSGSSQETLSSGISQKALRKLSGDSQEALSKLSGDSQLRNLSGNSQEALRRLSGSSQEALKRLSGSSQETTFQSLQAPVWDPSLQLSGGPASSRVGLSTSEHKIIAA